VLRDILVQCPDDPVTVPSGALGFLGDPPLESVLLQDISTARSALGNGEFKASAVLAGSVVEALLLWGVQRPAVAGGHGAAFTKWETREQRLGRKPPEKLHPDPTRWSLAQYVGVSRELPVISEKTADGADLARDFRNFIHPGKVERSSVKPSTATAHLAVGAMEAVIEDMAGRVKAGTL
jgi:hypothetical protein